MNEIHVVAGAVVNAAGQVLIAQRPPGKHMAGGWEFPGGKRDGGETAYQALVRELREELNIAVIRAEPVVCYAHRYPDRSVVLDLWLIAEYQGIPQSAEGQSIRWVGLQDLECAGLLDADRPMIAPLQAACARNIVQPK